MPTLALALALALAVACRGRRPPLVQSRVAAVGAPLASPGLAGAAAAPAWMYWEPVEVPVAGIPPARIDLPLSDTQLVRSAGAEALWSEAAPAIRLAVTHRGFAVVAGARPFSRLGDCYASLRDERIPWVLTLDALFFLAHLALDRALAEVDATVIVPAVATLLRRLETRLAAESRVAPADVAPSYLVARGIVDVALALAPRAAARPEAPGLAPPAATDTAPVLARTGSAVTRWLGAPIDETALAPRGAADRDDSRVGWFLTMAWLQNASLVLEGAGERNAHARVDVATARVHARAALLLSRLVERDVDREAADAWERLERLGELIVGEAEGVTPRDLSWASSRAELDIRTSDWIANVVRVDRVRHAAALGRAGAAFHLLGPRSTPDGDLLQSLTFPGQRTFPKALDVAAWLGSGVARAALHEAGDDADERYGETLERLIRARPEDAPLATSGRHRTPYLSMIDAIETWLAPSAGDAVQPAASTSEWRKRKAETALSAWTELRHDATALTRIPASDLPLPPRSSAHTGVPAFVEPHPEAIAKLVALVRQTARVLLAERMVASGTAAVRILDEVDDLLWTALGAAVYETADQPLPPMLEADLLDFPTRLRALETMIGETGAGEVPLAIDVHLDAASARVLEETTGRIQEAWIAMREPGTHRVWLALGASIPHYELVQPAAHPLTDDDWRARLQTQGEPPPSSLARAYVLEAADGVAAHLGSR